jgi:hypothetical protein
MTISAQSIIRRAADILQDQTSIHWPVNELVRWLNDAQRAIIRVRPDAMNTTATMMLAPGTRQDLDNGALTPLPAKLIEITRNVAASSNKTAITKVDRQILDRQTPGWHNITPLVNVAHYMFDPRDPKTFYVYPPATALAQLEVMYCAYPTDIAEPTDGATWLQVTGNLSVPDIYADDVLDIVLSRAYSKDAEFAGNAQLAAAYLQKAVASLGAEVTATVAVGPKP